jgi:hypothetical protein
MPFHSPPHDEISDFFGMDSHSGEGFAILEWGKNRCSLHRPFSDEAFKKNNPPAHYDCHGKAHLKKRRFIAAVIFLSIKRTVVNEQAAPAT